MGNWMKIKIEGSCEAKDVASLEKALDSGKDFENLHCLSSTRGPLSLPMWAAKEINVVGNLAERDYTVEDVANQLKRLAEVAPSLKVKIHCGGEFESPDCIATITLKGGEASIGEPEIEVIDKQADTATYAETLASLF